ncbi:hypothetical protein [Candidatus Rickettsia kedanie]|uniref:Uncharacterized protein n=1 Tax=Candidatus Rickettsia kedanie TaxID=3115352 RepID=A0ABP9TXD0_9RICK
MSSQRKNTLKNLIKKGTFASTAAMIFASTSALGVRTVIGPNAVLSMGFNLDDGTPFASGDDLILG